MRILNHDLQLLDDVFKLVPVLLRRAEVVLESFPRDKITILMVKSVALAVHFVTDERVFSPACRVLADENSLIVFDTEGRHHY